MRTTRHLQGIRTGMGSWRLSFTGRLKGAKRGSDNFLWLPVATAKAIDFLRGEGVYFADARDRFIAPTRPFFGFSGGKRRVLLLGGREAVN